MKKIFFSLGLLFAFSSMAHDGPHGPEQKVAPHGGVLRDSASLMFELVKESNSIKIFPLTHEGKPIEAKQVEINTKKTILTDSKKKTVGVTLVPEGNSFNVQFEKGASYRYALNLVASYQGKENKASWQIELGNE